MKRIILSQEDKEFLLRVVLTNREQLEHIDCDTPFNEMMRELHGYHHKGARPGLVASCISMLYDLHELDILKTPKRMAPLTYARKLAGSQFEWDPVYRTFNPK